MKWEQSFCNSTIIKNDLKRFWWISLITAIFMIFTKPIQIASEYSRDYMSQYMIENILSFNNLDDLFNIIILFVPILIAVMLFRYIHVKKSCAFMHKVPIKRSVIYNSHIISGLILILIPIIINTLILIPTLISCDLYEMYNFTYVIKWTSIIIVAEISIFMFSVFVGMLTGTSWSHGILTCIFLALPVALGSLIFQNIEYLIYGFSSNTPIDNLAIISPFTRLSSMDILGDNFLIGIFIYLVESIIVYFISKQIYKIRKSEASGNTIAFPILIPFFKCGVIISFMTLFVLFFKGINGKTLFILIGYMIFALIGYIASEVFVNKSFRIFKNIKIYLYFCIAIIIAAVGLKFDVIGYERYVPEFSEIQEVKVGEYIIEEKEGFHEEENINSILALHKNVVKDKNVNKTFKGQTRRLAILYILNNGKTVSREYHIPYKAYEGSYKDIYESEESKKINYKDILEMNSDKVDKIKISGDYEKTLGITNESEIREMLDIIKEEIKNIKYEDIEGDRSWGYIQIYYNSENSEKEPSCSVRWSKSFIKLEKYLEEKGELNKVRTMPEDIEYAVVRKLDGKKEAWEVVDDIRNESKGESEKALEIKDKQEIDTCLRNSENYYRDGYEREGYIIEYHLKDRGNPMFEKLTGNLVPEFIREYFKEN